ncbi:MAG TPA: hypothetical protein V6C69_11395 [Trichormus sp.]|jgi:hypothetical protein
MAVEAQSHASSGAATHLDSVQQAIESLKTTGFHTEMNQDRSLPSNTSTAARSDTAPSVGGASAAKIASDGSIDFHPSPTSAATPAESSGWLASAGHDAALFGEGLVSGAVLNPINALGQLSNHALGTDFGTAKFSNQDEVNNSMSGKIGEFLGTTADFIGLTVATGGLGDAVGLGAVGAMSLDVGSAGAIEGGLLTPTSNKNFIAGRLENAGIGAAAGAAGVAGGALAGAVADGVGSLGGQIALETAGSTAVGAALGAATAEVGSLATTGHSASSDQLKMAVAAGAIGGAIGGVTNTLGSFRTLDDVRNETPLPPQFR